MFIHSFRHRARWCRLPDRAASLAPLEAGLFPLKPPWAVRWRQIGVKKKIPINGSALFSRDDLAGDCAGDQANRKRRHDCERKVAPEAMTCLVQEFLGCIAALPCGMACDTDAIFDCVGDRAGCARSLVNGFSNVVGGSIHYVLRHPISCIPCGPWL
jgi:hypothetical protein